MCERGEATGRKDMDAENIRCRFINQQGRKLMKSRGVQSKEFTYHAYRTTMQQEPRQELFRIAIQAAVQIKAERSGLTKHKKVI